MFEYTLWDAHTGKGVSRHISAVLHDPPEGLRRHDGARLGDEYAFDIETGVPYLADPVPTQAELKAAVNRERDRRIETGKDFGGIRLTGSDRDQKNLMALGRKAEKLKAAGVTDPVIPFRDGHDVIHWLTPDQMLDLEEEGFAFVSACYQAAWLLKDGPPGVEGYEIPQEVAANQYWPP